MTRIQTSLVSLLLLSGCLTGGVFKPSFAFTSGQKGNLSSAPVECDVRFVSLPPDGKKFEEIGTIQQTTGAAPVGGYNAETMREVLPAVCQAGGILVYTELSGMGFLVRGVVFKERIPSSHP